MLKTVLSHERRLYITFIIEIFSYNIQTMPITKIVIKRHTTELRRIISIIINFQSIFRVYPTLRVHTLLQY